MPPIDLESLNQTLSNSSAGWRAQSNPILELPDDVRQRLLGVNVDRAKLADLARLPRAFLAPVNLPARVDWRNFNGANHVSPVKDQGGCGSCVSFCVSATVESAASISGAGIADLSEADLHFCSTHGANCGGWWPSDALEQAKARGITTEALFPYASAFGAGGGPSCRVDPNRDSQLYHPTGYTALQSMAERKNWLANRGPVCAVIHVYDDFFAAGDAVYRHVTGNSAGYHCIEVIGYSDPDGCWIAKNSWNTTWGDAGFFRIAYGECGIDETSNDRDPDGSLNRFPMYGVDGVTTPSAWRQFQLAGANTAASAGGIAALSRIPSSMELWSIAPDGSVKDSYWYEGGAWNTFDLAPPASASPTGGITAVSRIPGSMEVWWIGNGGSVEAAFWYEGSTWQRYQIAPAGSASPTSGIAAVSRITNSMELWWIAPNGSVQGAFWYEGGTWQRYELAPAGSAAVTSGVAVVSRIPGSMELWWVAPNGSVQDAFWYEGGAWQRFELAPAGSASPQSGIAAVSRIPGSMELWWIAPNGSVQDAYWYEGGAWQRFELAPAGSGSPSGGIAAVSRIPGSMEIWWIGANGSIQDAFWYDGGAWQRFELASANSASRDGSVAAVSRISGSMELWWTGANQSLQDNYWYG